ncbi:sterol desaturase family protein [Arenicella sp. 4NH20-0111]|uniref:sterol desaturase family protein n=1 Tax=Arenicella sp. 4NH20-0111 TaxID=3127648 RepID=UPI003105C8AC
MNIILYAIPFFFLLIAMELIAERVKGTDYYRVNDSLTSLATGVINQIVNVSKRLIPFTLYVLVEQQFSIFQLGDSWIIWVIAFVLYDFCYYWNHRMGHEINFLWASHVVHHSSEEYNLTTALRQTGTGFFGVIFYLPLAILGFDPVIILSVGALNLVYQFWVHTRHIGKLGFLEKIFVTPSNHRAHHAQNSVYIDRNYGGVFILWDRLFGSFQEELDSHPVIFGITGAVKSWNPLWINAQVYASLLHDAWHTKRWQDKLTIWFRRTGWRPADVEEKFPLEKVDLTKFHKFDIQIPNKIKLYAVLQYVQLAALALLFSVAASSINVSDRFQIITYVIVGLFGIGATLETRPFAGILEWIRNSILLVSLFKLPFLLGLFLALITLVSLPFLFLGRLELERNQAITESLNTN